MKASKTWLVVLVCIALTAGLMGCRGELSDDDIDRIVDRMVENPRVIHEDSIEDFVDAFLDHPKYMEYLQDDEWIETFTDAMMVHPMVETTPKEDCTTIILMAAVMSGDYTLPPDSDVDQLCTWYLSQLERK